MNIFRLRIGLIAVLVALLLPVAVNAAPVLTVQPASGPAGTNFSFTASGFAAKEYYSLWINGPSGDSIRVKALETQKTSADGIAAFSWISSKSLPLGEWRMVIHGLDSNTEQVIQFAITPAPQSSAPPVRNVSPEAGPAGTTFVFYASDLADSERYSIWVNGPNGESITTTANDTQRTTLNGAASFSWTSPTNLAPGSWTMVIHGLKSGTEKLIGFTITAANDVPATGSQVVPTVARAGSLFKFYQTGFKAGERVDVSVAGPNGQIKDPNITLSGLASAEGRVDGTWTSPSDAVAGTWYIYFRGTESDTNRTISVTITTNTTPTVATLTVSPAQGRAGSPFLFSANGFSSDEHLSVWLNTPDGRTIPAEIDNDNPQAGPSGNASWGWKAPADAMPGTWQMVAHGRDSGREAVASVVIVP